METYDRFAAKKGGKTFYLAGEELKKEGALDNLTEKDTLIVLGIPDNLREIKECLAHKKILILPAGSDDKKYLKKVNTIERYDSSKVPEKELKVAKDFIAQTASDKDLLYLSLGVTKTLTERYGEVEVTSNGLFDDVWTGPTFVGPKLAMSCEDGVFDLVNAGYWVITEWDTKFASKGLRVLE